MSKPNNIIHLRHDPISGGHPSQNQFKPIGAIVLYESPNGVVATNHDLRLNEGRTEFGPGRIMSQEQQSQFAALMDSRTGGQMLIPENVLLASAGRLMWYVPGAVRSLHFRVQGRKPQVITAPYPTLLFDAREEELRVYALKTRKRPDADTALYHAPLMNIYRDGRLCRGTATLPATFEVESRGEWEQAVFDTAYSHTNHSDTLNLKDKRSVSNMDHLRFWRELEKEKATRFPSRALKPFGHTVSVLLRQGA